jgi:hypothetical protein
MAVSRASASGGMKTVSSRHNKTVRIFGLVKVNLTLCLIQQHVIKTYGGTNEWQSRYGLD